MNFSRLNSILNWSVKVGVLFGIPIRLHVTIVFFLLPAFAQIRGIGFWYGVEFGLGIVLSILLHELGHALTAKHYNQSGLSIMLHGFGGFAVSQGRRTPKQELIIVLMGPGTTFVIGILALVLSNAGMRQQAISPSTFIQFEILHVIGSLNILMGFLNLIPCFPFDGGLALAAILSFRIPEFKALRHVAHLGLILGPALAIWGLAKDQRFFIIFGLMGGISSYFHLRNSGGVRFSEARDDRRARKEEEAYRKRSREKNDAYLDEVNKRAREREEQERLRKLLE